MSEIVTVDLSRFGYRELGMAAELLEHWSNGNRPDFLGDGITLNMNTYSGNVFLCDEEYNVGMMHCGKLEQFHSCGECGEEGFRDELEDTDNHYFDEDDCLQHGTPNEDEDEVQS